MHVQIHHSFINLCKSQIYGFLLETEMFLINLILRFSSYNLLNSNLISGGSRRHIRISWYVWELNSPKNRRHIHGLQLVHVLPHVINCNLKSYHLISSPLPFSCTAILAARASIDTLCSSNSKGSLNNPKKCVLKPGVSPIKRMGYLPHS